MGRKVSDGKAFDLTVPDGTAVADGELIRAGGLNGCIVGEVAQTADANGRTRSAEAAHDFIHEIHVPSGLNPAVGDVLFWAAPGSFQYGPTNLQAAAATAGDSPCFFVTKTRVADNDGNYVIRGRVLNGVHGWAS